MKREDFLNEIISAIKISTQVKEETVISDIKEWDSLAILTLIALFHKNFNFRPDTTSLKNCKNLKEILDLGVKYYEK